MRLFYKLYIYNQNNVTQAEIDEIIEKLEPYNVIVSTAVFY